METFLEDSPFLRALCEADDGCAVSAFDNLRQYVAKFMPLFPVEMLDAWKAENEGRETVGLPSTRAESMASIVAWLDLAMETALLPLERWARDAFVRRLCSPTDATDDQLYYEFVRDSKADDPIGGKARKNHLRDVLSRCMSFQSSVPSVLRAPLATRMVFWRLTNILKVRQGLFVFREDLMPFNSRVWKFDPALDDMIRGVWERTRVASYDEMAVGHASLGPPDSFLLRPRCVRQERIQRHHRRTMNSRTRESFSGRSKFHHR